MSTRRTAAASTSRCATTAWCATPSTSCGGATATIITVVENARVVRDADGGIVGYEGTLADISERKRAEMQLSAEKEKAQVTLQSIGDAVITVDADGRIEYLNPVAESLTGWETREAAGRPAADVFQTLGESNAPADRRARSCAA